MKKEAISHGVLDDLANRNDNWEKLDGIPERVDTIETDATTLELRVGENETDIASLETNKLETKVKITSVEKELNSLKSININSNQEATQVAQGYGVVSLPKTAGEGHADFGIKGETRTNLIKYSNMDKDTNGDGVVDDFNKYQAATVTSIISFDDVKKAQKVEITGGTSVVHTEINQYVDNINPNDVISFRVSAEIIGNIKAGVDILWFNGATYLSGAIGVRTTGSEIVTKNAIAPANTTRAQIIIRIHPNAIGGVGTIWLKNAMVEKASDVGNYISTGTKSTISASRLKSVGISLVNPMTINEFIGATDVNIVTLNNKRYWKITGASMYMSNKELFKGKFLPSTQYTFRWSTYQVGSGNARLRMIYTDGTTRDVNTAPTLEALSVTTSTVGKTISHLVLLFSVSSSIETYICIDDFMIYKGTDANIPYEPYTESTQYLPNVGELRSLPNGVADEIVNGELVKRVSDTMEELAEPIITPINVSGNLISYPSGTVYIEQVVADAGLYTDKMDILNTDLPIKTLDKLSKVDYTTGLEHSLDVSKAVVTSQSFTHPDLVENDIVFFEYYYDLESTNGNASVEYYDSRYTVKDSVTDKVYKWSITIANGVPTITTVEV